MKRYLRIYGQYLKFTLKYMLVYRVNTLAKSFFFPAWQISLFVVVLLVFNQIPEVAGWTRAEATILFLVVQITFATMYFVYFEGGLRRMTSHLVRRGDMDGILVKPLSPQFQAMLSQPDVAPLLSLTVTLPLFFYFVISTGQTMEATAVALFITTLVANSVATYWLLSAVATAAFYTAQSRELIEFVDKGFEYAHYPVTVFPGSIQLLFFTVIPIAYLGYISTSFLVDKGSLSLLLLSLAALPVSYVINQLAWREGLKRYSSASS